MTDREPPRQPGFTPWPDREAERYLSEGHWGRETLGDLLASWARRSPGATALVDGDRRLSYADLDRSATDAAHGLARLGIAPGDRVVVQLPNTADFAVLLFGLARLGAVPVMALPGHRRVEVTHLAAHSEAVAYAVPDTHAGFDHRALAAEVADAVPGLKHVLVAGDPGGFTPLAEVLAPVPAGEEPPAPARVHPGQVAVLLVSGGTTGTPKLIPRTHRDYAYNARASARVCGLGPEDVYLVCLPAAHNFPLACPGILGILGAGGTAVMCPSPGPDTAFPLVSREGATVTALVPSLTRLWVEVAEDSGAADLASLRLLQVGGAKLDRALAERVTPVLGSRVQQVFGMAEGLLNFTRADDGPDLVNGTQGRPLSPADEVRVVGEDGAEVEPGRVGELLTRGPYTMRGYYRADEYNATAFTSDGFFRSGDLVRRLPSGHLVVEGRVKDVVNRGGENVPAAELEDHLYTHPAVSQAAVVGLPDDNLGEVVCAVLVLEPGRSRPRLREVKAFLRERGLAAFKLPDRLAAVDTLPLTPIGKVDKKSLIQELLSRS